jgi:hypothetical protein
MEEEHGGGVLSPVLTTSGAPLFFLRLWRGISCARSWARRTSRLRSDSADKKITRSTHRVRRDTAADAPRELAPGHPR